MERGYDRIMFVRTDDGSVEGVFKTDGYVDARRFSSTEVARFIVERVGLSASIAVEETRISALEKAVAKFAPRTLSEKQLLTLKNKLQTDPGYANVTLAVTSVSAKTIFQNLIQCFKDAGYETRDWVSMDTKLVDHISLKTHDLKALTKRQSIVMEALTSIGLDVVAEYERPNPANDRPLDIWLVIR